MILKTNFKAILKTTWYSILTAILSSLFFYIAKFDLSFIPWFLIILFIIDFPAWLLLIIYLFKNFGKQIVITDTRFSIIKNGVITNHKLESINNVIVKKSKSEAIRHPCMNYFYIKIEFSDAKQQPEYITCLMSRDIEEVLRSLKFKGNEEYSNGIAFLWG
jgi:uncharacterized protein YpiB (UPF0302 family)